MFGLWFLKESDILLKQLSTQLHFYSTGNTFTLRLLPHFDSLPISLALSSAYFANFHLFSPTAKY